MSGLEAEKETSLLCLTALHIVQTRLSSAAEKAAARTTCGVCGAGSATGSGKADTMVWDAGDEAEVGKRGTEFPAPSGGWPQEEQACETDF